MKCQMPSDPDCTRNFALLKYCPDSGLQQMASGQSQLKFFNKTSKYCTANSFRNVAEHTRQEINDTLQISSLVFYAMCNVLLKS